MAKKSTVGWMEKITDADTQIKRIKNITSKIKELQGMKRDSQRILKSIQSEAEEVNQEYEKELEEINVKKERLRNSISKIEEVLGSE